MRKSHLRRTAKVLISIFLCLALTAPKSVALEARPGGTASGDVQQIAEILGVSSQVERIKALNASGGSQQELLNLKGQVLQKVLMGFLEVRRAGNRNWRELSYSYNVLRREQRKQDLINQCFTLLNFGQLSTLYTLEPYLRLDNYFKASAICTSTGNGVGVTLPVINIVQQKTAFVRHTEPPEAMHDLNLIDGGPINGTGMPEHVQIFLDSPAPGATMTRRQEMFEMWKKRYHVDPAKESSLCSLHDDHAYKKTLRTLHTRILLLWSVRTYILDMDTSLLELMRQIRSPASGRIEPVDPQHGGDATLASLGVGASVIQAAKLLNIESEVAQLVSLKKSGSSSGPDNFRTQQLEVAVLENVLYGALEVRAAVDEVDAEINYASDVVLEELLAKRGKALQRNYEANFIQAGTFGSCAGLLYLTGYGKAGNEMFVISGGIGTVLSTEALYLMRGGRRKIDTKPNSLADVFKLPQQDEYRFSPLMAAFLNSPEPDSKDGQTRRQELLKYWKEHKITTVNLDKPKTLDQLAAAPPAQFDTIKIVANRIAMLRRLLAKIEDFDPELLNILMVTDCSPPERAPEAVATAVNVTPGAQEGAKLLGIQSTVDRVRAASGDSKLPDRLILERRVLTTAMDVRSTVDTLDDEISYESDVLGRMTRGRDSAIALTNNINFYQLNILAIIIDGELGLSGNPRWVRASNMLNIVSGLAVGTLAGMTVLEQRGGMRPLPARPNMLGQCLGMVPSEEYRFSPEVWGFITAVPPTSSSGRTRVDQLREVWKQEKNIYPNMDKQSTREKMAAYGQHHTRLSETIKVVKTRLNLLYDVQGLVGLFDSDLDELMRSVG